jgi:hypothetical protein
MQLVSEHPNDISKNRCYHSTQARETIVNEQSYFCCNNPKFGREQFLVCMLYVLVSESILVHFVITSLFIKCVEDK